MKSVMTTFTGKRVDPLDLKPEDIDILDIAHHLSLINRFCGATREPISVAQHSVFVSKLVGDRISTEKFALQGLLHDASEAYLGDVIKWVKDHELFKFYREIENKTQRMIYKIFNCPEDQHPSVDRADTIMVRYEAQHQMKRMDVPDGFVSNYPPITPEEERAIGHWFPYDWKLSRREFLFTFNELTNSIL